MKERIFYLDAIKVFLSIMVVAHHAGQSYGSTGGAWLIFDSNKVEGLNHFFFFNAAYLMPLYFFISGYFSFSSILNKSFLEFLKDRIKKLGVPLLVISFCVFIPIHYLTNDKNYNIFEFIWNLYVNKPPLAVGHLWFVLSLLVYSIIFASFFKFLKMNEVKLKFNKFYPLFFIIISSVIGYFIRLEFPVDKWVTWGIPIEPAHLPLYLLAFYSGIMTYKNNWIENLNLRIALLYFFVCVVIISFIKIFNLQLNYLVYQVILESMICCCMTLLIISIFKRFANNENIMIKNIAANNYGIYIFHLFFVLLFQYFFLKFECNGILKFIAVTSFSFLVSWIFSFLLRKNIKIRNII